MYAGKCKRNQRVGGGHCLMRAVEFSFFSFPFLSNSEHSCVPIMLNFYVNGLGSCSAYKL